MSNQETNVRHNPETMECYYELPNPGLRSYFGRVVEGQPDEYRTPFFKGKTLDEILDPWLAYLSEHLSNKWPTLLEFEKDLAEKVGPMSVMKPLSERMEDIDHYYDDILLSSKPILPEAIVAATKEWGNARGLRLRDQKNVVENMKKSTSSGNPFFAKRKTVVNKTLTTMLDYYPEFKNCHQTLGGSGLKNFGNYVDMYYNASKPVSEWESCAILGWRGQEGGRSKSDVKQRVVWMFPFGVNINELMLYQPLIEVAQKLNLVPAWVSMEAVDQKITAMFDTKGVNDLVICTDFSKFDQHFNADMQDCALQMLRNICTQDALTEYWFDNVFPVKYNIPLNYDWEKFRFGAHGMASGSGGTNADETLVHRCLQHEAAILHGSKLNPNSQCLGDDGVLTYPGITVEDVMQSYTSHGQEMNESKQYVSTQDCVYLRRWHHKDYRVDGICAGVYSTCRALGRLAEQERYYDPESWGPKMVALRQLSILENCKYHPLREEFADYCMKGDKFRLGLDIPGFFDELETIAIEAIDHMPDFLGYTKSLQAKHETSNLAKGIADWWIVKYLKSKA